MEWNFIVMILSAFATGVGAIPALLFKNISHRRMDSILAYTAGIMVAASTYGLIPASLKLTNLYVLCFGLLAGALLLNILEYVIPHMDVDHTRTDVVLPQQSVMLLLAMTLHNIPEGLSVGAGLASEVENLGFVVALSMGLQNAPEGFLVAMFLLNQDARRRVAIMLAFGTGLIECLASFIGYSLVHVALFLVPYGLAFAAGAMLFSLQGTDSGNTRSWIRTSCYVFLSIWIAEHDWYR
ncbi:Zinc transporter ZupT [Halobacillus karajensis]|uniref:Zinc transporter ZupT n=1 Tax=Halobacillus karajensis TaxID=195088 RepID=A0A024P4Q6_9BACI|nr:Zinc transporter ZupT [Halobacillus karajensis]CDQ23865.1 Zinc transporter ZupT [Halobacillus karajensis]CDQ27343.1 Zinc transporter ZupT [Halobacillus karajensis]